MSSLNSKEFFKDSFILIISGIAYFIISVLTPMNKELINVYANLPWGVFTSLFIYDGWQNVIFFTICIFLLFAFNFRLPKLNVKSRALFSTASMFIIGLIANVFWVIRNPLLGEYGQSGVVFALYGIVFAFSFSQISYIFEDLKRGWRSLNFKERRKLKISISILVIPTLIFLQLTVNVGQFLNENNGVAYQVHGVSFFLGILFGFLFIFFKEVPRHL